MSDKQEAPIASFNSLMAAYDEKDRKDKQRERKRQIERVKDKVLLRCAPSIIRALDNACDSKRTVDALWRLIRQSVAEEKMYREEKVRGAFATAGEIPHSHSIREAYIYAVDTVLVEIKRITGEEMFHD